MTGMAIPGWSNSFANGQNIKTAQAWGDLIRSYYPDYTGPYPKVQIFHGTADSTLDYPNLSEQMKEWSNAFGITFTKSVTKIPQSGYPQMVYGDGSQLVGYLAQGVGRTVPIHESMDLAWFSIA